MKKVALLTSTSQIGSDYMNDLEEIFRDHCSFERFNTRKNIRYYQSTIESSDLCLTSDSLSNLQSENLQIDKTKFIDLKASFAKDKLDHLLEIKEPIHFIFRYKYSDSCVRIIDIFRDYGITNFIWSHQKSKLVREEAGYKNIVIKENFFNVNGSYLKGIDTKLIYDLGFRRIAFDSLMQIKNYLDIDDPVVDNRILAYASDYSSIDSQYFSIFKKSAISEYSLEKLISYMDNSIAIVDKDLKLLTTNEHFNKKFVTSKNKNLGDIEKLREIIPSLRTGKKLTNYVLTNPLNKTSYIVNAEPLDFMDGALKSSNLILIIDHMDKINKKQEVFQSNLIKGGHYAKYNFTDILGSSPTLKETIKLAKKMSKIDKTTLIVGETGTGKELFAHSIHNESLRKNKPFVSINCAAIPNDLLESELFGYEPGSFTGGTKEGKLGLFEIANGGSLFLDEIGELNYSIQSKLLRAIETQEIMKVGGSTLNKVDIRIIAATNRNLIKQVKSKEFREDLYFRINNFEISIPPLRDRSTDILDLAKNFIYKELASPRKISKELEDFLLSYSWPGNIRELKNVIEYMVNLYEGDLDLNCLPSYLKNLNLKAPRKETKDEIHPLEDDLDHKELRQILLILETYDLYSRADLIKKLLAKGLKITDYRLRKNLLYLKDQGYVVYSQGPGRIKITKKAQESLEKGKL